MINGKISEHGTGKPYQPGLWFIAEGATSIAGDRALDKEVWCFSNPGISLCSTSQRDEPKNGYTGSNCGIYCQNTYKPNYQNKKFAGSKGMSISKVVSAALEDFLAKKDHGQKREAS